MFTEMLPAHAALNIYPSKRSTFYDICVDIEHELPLDPLESWSLSINSRDKGLNKSEIDTDPHTSKYREGKVW